MTSSIHYDPKVSMEMRDGTLMAGEVYRPDDRRKHPAIILRTPYHADEVINFSYARLLPSLQAGYAVVVAYQRGRFGSGGTYNLAAPQQIEGADCYDTVEWVASQPWCDGNIGMAGESARDGTVAHSAGKPAAFKSNSSFTYGSARSKALRKYRTRRYC